MKWLLCFMIGLIVGFIGFCNNLAVENLAGIKFVTTSNMMLERRYYLCSLEILNLFFSLFLCHYYFLVYVADKTDSKLIAGLCLPFLYFLLQI